MASISASHNMLKKLNPKGVSNQLNLFDSIAIKFEDNYQNIVSNYPVLMQKMIDYVILELIEQSKTTIVASIDKFYEEFDISEEDYNSESFKRLFGRYKEKMKKRLNS